MAHANALVVHIYKVLEAEVYNMIFDMHLTISYWSNPKKPLDLFTKVQGLSNSAWCFAKVDCR